MRTDVLPLLRGPDPCDHGHLDAKEHHQQGLVAAREGVLRLPCNVGVTNGLHLVDVILVCKVIEMVKELADDAYHLPSC